MTIGTGIAVAAFCLMIAAIVIAEPGLGLVAILALGPAALAVIAGALQKDCPACDAAGRRALSEDPR